MRILIEITEKDMIRLKKPFRPKKNTIQYCEMGTILKNLIWQFYLGIKYDFSEN